MEKTSGQGALQRLMQWCVAHLFGDTPPAERTDRAHRTLIGQLTAGAPFVTDSFATGYDSAATAISPTGVIAIAGTRRTADGYRGELIVRSPNGARSAATHAWRWARPPSVRVFFVEHSTQPVVIVDQRLFWGDWDMMLPRDLFAFDGPSCTLDSKKANLNVWALKNGRRFVAFTLGGILVVRTRDDQGGEDEKDHETGPVRWAGLVDNELVSVATENEADNRHEVVRWKGMEFALAVGETVVQSTFRATKDGHLQFVTNGKDGASYLVDWNLEEEAWENALQKFDIVLLEEDSLSVLRPTADNRWERWSVQDQLLWDMDGRMGILPELPPGPHGPWPVHALSPTCVAIVAEIWTPRDSMIRHVILCRMGQDAVRTSVGYDQTRIRRLGDGIVSGVWTPGNVFVWQGEDATREFPCYGPPEDLAAVDLDGTKALMAVVFTDGTLHVVRYDLPR